MPDDEVAPQDLTAVIQQLAAQQAQLQAMMAKQNEEMSQLRQHNDQLQAELNGAKDRKANGLQHHSAPAMTEDQRWRAMNSEGGLLG
jgi:cell division protein FtsB